MKNILTGKRVAWLLMGSFIWGAGGASALISLTPEISGTLRSMIYGVLSTTAMTFLAVKLIRFPLPEREWHCIFYPAIGLILAIIGRYVGSRFYGW